MRRFFFRFTISNVAKSNLVACTVGAGPIDTTTDGLIIQRVTRRARELLGTAERSAADSNLGYERKFWLEIVIFRLAPQVSLFWSLWSTPVPMNFCMNIIYLSVSVLCNPSSRSFVGSSRLISRRQFINYTLLYRCLSISYFTYLLSRA